MALATMLLVVVVVLLLLLLLLLLLALRRCPCVFKPLSATPLQPTPCFCSGTGSQRSSALLVSACSGSRCATTTASACAKRTHRPSSLRALIYTATPRSS